MNNPTENAGGEALVVRSTGKNYQLRLPSGEIRTGVLRGKMRLTDIKTTNPVAVGDRVLFREEEDVLVVTDVQPRHNYLIRKATKKSSQEQILCANIDQAVMVVTIDYPFTKLAMVDRFLVMAGAYHIPAALVFNKRDLMTSEKLQDKLLNFSSLYRKVGYPVLRVNATDPDCRPAIIELLKDKKTFLTGLSGAGKSTLVNLADPNLNLRTNEISTFNQKGKHTTTFAEMFPLEFGGYVVDAPGLREFRLTGMEPHEVAHFFPEMLPMLEFCRYNNCTHVNEPECGVIDAVMEGLIAESRYFNYLKMLEEDVLPEYKKY